MSSSKHLVSKYWNKYRHAILHAWINLERVLPDLLLLMLTTVDETLQLSLTANKHQLICISFIPFLLVEFCFLSLSLPSYEFSLFNRHYRLNPNSLRNTLEVQKIPLPSVLVLYDGWTNFFLCLWAWLKSHLSDPRWAYGLKHAHWLPGHSSAIHNWKL